MLDLQPTPTRIMLLQQIADGLVFGDATGNSWLDERLAPFYDPMAAGRWKVTGSVKRQTDAGWIEMGEQRKYRLTDVGHQVLAGVTGSQPPAVDQ